MSFKLKVEQKRLIRLCRAVWDASFVVCANHALDQQLYRAVVVHCSSLGSVVPDGKRVLFCVVGGCDLSVDWNKSSREELLVFLPDFVLDQVVPIGICDELVRHILELRRPLGEKLAPTCIERVFE